jgi:hypothetical protein
MDIKWQRVACSLAVLTLTASTPCFAQGGVLWGEIGRQQNVFGNATSIDSIGWGFGAQLTIGGDSSQSSGFAIPVGFELRSDTKFEALDLLGVADLAFRVRNVSFGPGGSMGFIMRQDLEDVRCLGTLPNGSSCFARTSDNAGMRDIGEFYGIGLSGFVKTTFGPQGRAFMQVRYIYYHPDWMYFRSTAEALNANLGTTFDLPTDFPEFDHGRDVRVSAGYILGGADRSAMMLRVQYTDKRFNFTSTGANSNRMFDQHGRQLTMGVGIAF